ncbi:hypothetical protein Q7P35_003161 [Cladosporium inversicolor]
MSFSKPRGGRNPWRRPSTSKPPQGPIRTPPAPPLGTLLENLTPDQFNEAAHDNEDKLEITDPKFLASYSWTDAKAPSIIFPGKSQRPKSSNITSSTIIDQKQRHANPLEPPHRSNKTPARLRKVLQRPQLRPPPKPPHRTGRQSFTRTASAFQHRESRLVWMHEHDRQSIGGRLIPQHAIFELKTRGAHKKGEDQMTDHLPRMWLAQIPFFILAFHEFGLFKPENITVRDVRGDVASWQDGNQKLLRMFSTLLGKLVAMARDPEVGKYEVCLQQRGVLEIRKQRGKVSSPLPSPLTWIWADQDYSESGSSPGSVTAGGGASDADVAAHSEADDDDFPEDFTACSDACDYCGRCSYKLR